MCTYSMIYADWTNPGSLNHIPPKAYESDPLVATQMLLILEAIKKLDERMGGLEKCVLNEKQKKEFEEKLHRAANPKP